MKKFKDYTKKRKYVSVNYDKQSQKMLRDWCEYNGFDLTVSYNGSEQKAEDFDFHTTIFYSTNEVNLKNQTISESPTEVYITGIKFLGENKDIPVFTISSSGLNGIREYYESLGLEDAWDEYIPHISLSYAKKSVDPNTIKLPTFRPKFNKIVVSDIEDYD